MITNRAEWDEWFQNQQRRCKEYQKKKVNDSIELKIALNQTNYQDAETIVLEILGNEKMGIFDEFME